MIFKQRLAGIAVCILAAVATSWLCKTYNLPVMLIALIAGLLLHGVLFKDKLKDGISYSSNQLLKLGVALIGLQVTLGDLVSLGWQTVAFLLAVVLSTLGLGLLLAKVLRQNRNYGYLSGGAVAICGASAALAVSSILPKDAKLERDTAVCIIGITLLSSLAMILYPYISAFFELNLLQSSLFLGGSIHNVAQVVGAAFTVSDEVGEFASMIKLLRVALLVPCILLILTSLPREAKKNDSKAPILPFFLVAFLVLMALNSFFNIEQNLLDISKLGSKFLLVTAMFAIGLKTHLLDITSVGFRPLFILFFETIWIAGLSLAGALFLF